MKAPQIIPDLGDALGVAATRGEESLWPAGWQRLSDLWVPAAGVQGAKIVNLCRGGRDCVLQHAARTWTASKFGVGINLAGGTSDEYGLFASSLVDYGTEHTCTMLCKAHNYGDLPLAGNAYNDGGYAFFFNNYNAIAYCNTAGNAVTFNLTGGPYQNLWVQWTVARKGTTVTLYRDGVQVDTDTLGSDDVLELRAIGAYSGGSYEYDGEIAMVAIHGYRMPGAAIREFADSGWWRMLARRPLMRRVGAVGGGATVQPDAVAMPMAVPAPTIAATVQPDPVALAMAVPSAVVQATVQPAPVAMPMGVPAATVAAAVQPAPVAMPMGLPSPTLAAAVQPDPLAMPMAIPSVSAGAPTGGAAAIAAYFLTRLRHG